MVKEVVIKETSVEWFKGGVVIDKKIVKTDFSPEVHAGWFAFFEGEPEGLKGRGITESEAIQDLISLVIAGDL